MQANRKHKDSVFTFLFSDPDKLRELYGALSGVTLPPDVTIEVKTLADVFFKDQINDIAFTVDNRLVILIEHQSTINPNMPLRMLMYIAREYEKLVDRRTIYRNSLVKIPAPECIVVYNGREPYKDADILHLSDAYMDTAGLKTDPAAPPVLNLTVKVYNINDGRNPEMVRRSEYLSAYSRFIGKTREMEAAYPGEREEAYRKAILYCIDHGILTDFLKEHASEVCNMLLTEWNMDEYGAVQREEGMALGLERGLERGLEQGREEGREEVVYRALAKGLPVSVISDITGLDTETVTQLAARG